MPVEGAHKTILSVHGRGADRHEGMRYARPLVNAGYNVMAIDMRHPRQNPKIISTMSFYERNDVSGAINSVKKRTPANDIGIMGFSMSAATSIIVMAKDQRIKTGVFNYSFANATDVLAENAKKLYGLPRYPLIPAVMSLLELRSGINADLMNPESYYCKKSSKTHSHYARHRRQNRQLFTWRATVCSSKKTKRVLDGERR